MRERERDAYAGFSSRCDVPNDRIGCRRSNEARDRIWTARLMLLQRFDYLLGKEPLKEPNSRFAWLENKLFDPVFAHAVNVRTCELLNNSFDVHRGSRDVGKYVEPSFERRTQGGHL